MFYWFLRYGILTRSLRTLKFPLFGADAKSVSSRTSRALRIDDDCWFISTKEAALKRYHVGGTPDGATLWWQIDEQGRARTGKAMQYNPLTGHRVKEQGFPVNWAYRMRRYGEPSELIVPQCQFGEHLASSFFHFFHTSKLLIAILTAIAGTLGVMNDE